MEPRTRFLFMVVTTLMVVSSLDLVKSSSECKSLSVHALIDVLDWDNFDSKEYCLPPVQEFFDYMVKLEQAISKARNYSRETRCDCDHRRRRDNSDSGTGWASGLWWVGAGIAAVVAAPVVLPALGFTAGGVAASSIAAAAQSTLMGGAIAKGSAFAAMQSLGATGLSVKAFTNLGIGTAGLAYGMGGSGSISNGDDGCYC